MQIFTPLGLALLLACVASAEEPSARAEREAEPSRGARSRGSGVPAALEQEAPPPPIEPELAPGSRLIDARADELVRKMSDLLASAQSFALEAEEIYDEVPEHVPRTQLANLRHVALRRPNRMAGDASGDAVEGTPGVDGMGTIAQGYLEMSNVDVVREMVNMITSQRAYEVSSKAIKAADEMLQMANSIRR